MSSDGGPTTSNLKPAGPHLFKMHLGKFPGSKDLLQLYEYHSSDQNL